MNVLERILATTREELAELAARTPLPAPARATLDVVARLRRPAGAPLRLIAENKRRSPSAGALSTVLSTGARARAYVEAGATMISVLVDRAHFAGGFAHLREAREAIGEAVPLLAKGFVIDELQLDAARAEGADAVLLIARILDAAALPALVVAAQARGLEPIVEVVDDAELQRALETPARVLGVNARDLATLEMDASRAARVLASIPARCVALHFSGVASAADVTALARRRPRLDGALVGEALMRADDPRPLLSAMAEAASADASG
jgi:indole-3-glycerol phosphate synthase